MIELQKEKSQVVVVRMGICLHFVFLLFIFGFVFMAITNNGAPWHYRGMPDSYVNCVIVCSVIFFCFAELYTILTRLKIDQNGIKRYIGPFLHGDFPWDISEIWVSFEPWGLSEIWINEDAIIKRLIITNFDQFLYMIYTYGVDICGKEAVEQYLIKRKLIPDREKIEMEKEQEIRLKEFKRRFSRKFRNKKYRERGV